MPSFLHRPRLLSVVATLLLLAGCQASGPASPTPSPVPPVDHTVRFAGSTLPSKTDTVRAIDVLSARLGTLKVGTFSAGAGALNVTPPAGSLPMPLEALAAILASGPLPDSWRQGP